MITPRAYVHLYDRTLPSGIAVTACAVPVYRLSKSDCITATRFDLVNCPECLEAMRP